MDQDLIDVLARSRDLGFLGPGPVEPHVAHALQLVDELDALPAGGGQARVVDLGSGGGIPGLVLARALPSSRWVLLDANERRTAFLAESVVELALEARVSVIRSRAERAGRDATLRGQFDAVVSRSFGAPAVTAECGAPFLTVGGRLFVSEPPTPDPARWPDEGLTELGLTAQSTGSWAVFEQTAPCPEKYPRREGQPGKRPLW